MKDRGRRLHGIEILGIAVFVSALALTTARAIGIEDVVDGGNTYAWQEVALPGTICGNGSQYRFYVYDSPTSNNMLMLFEGGGACWDYDTCSGRAGILGAAHPNGIPANYIQEFQPKYVSPLLNGADPGIPLRAKKDLATKGYDMVYMPYCTGDVHIGNAVVTYSDPTGANPPLTWRHNGYNNTIAALNHLRTRFPSINKLLVTGFSAGGVASHAGYYFARRTLLPAKGYMLNDSGPTFPAPNATYKSRPLHDLIKVTWNLPSVYGLLPATFNANDLGTMTDMIAREFPNDQLAYTGYSSDYNFSRFSYERFYPNMTQANVLAYWRADQTNFINKMKTYPRFSYHVPWHRPINASHCSSIITLIGSHSCPTVRKKKGFEIFELPWSQTWKCPSGNVPFDTFLTNWLNNNQVIRAVEPENNFNNEDPGMSIVAPLINDALDG
jgi:hypothetical protein